jgi:hypothetical protein
VSSIISPPEPPEKIVVDLRKILPRWPGSDLPTIEEVLTKAGVELVEIPQKPRKGVRLSDLLAFEERWREAELERAERHRLVTERQRQAAERTAQRNTAADRLPKEVGS